MGRMYDKLIIGAGIYGLYAALYSAKQGDQVAVLEKENDAFRRATYINQARVHMGYHYPRSFSTATKSANYFERFVNDFGFCIVDEFKQIYATSAQYSWTNAGSFMKFCRDAGIPCEEIPAEKYFNPGLCDGAFLTKEYAYDAMILRDHFLNDLEKYKNVDIYYSTPVTAIENDGDRWKVSSGDRVFESKFVLNASYASTNQIQKLCSFEPFGIKYELCEIILCSVCKELEDVGLTVMDGPFFSIMPFGKTGMHSLTSVTFTPHVTSYDRLPSFKCQEKSGGLCTPDSLYNCNDCPGKPATAYPYMRQLATKYMRPELEFTYERSLFSMKPILKASEVDDSRPTVIREMSHSPRFFSVLSGKINTIYDLDEVLKNE